MEKKIWETVKDMLSSLNLRYPLLLMPLFDLSRSNERGEGEVQRSYLKEEVEK